MTGKTDETQLKIEVTDRKLLVEPLGKGFVGRARVLALADATIAEDFPKIAEKLKDMRSKRRKQILARLKKTGKTVGAEAAKGALETRRTKTDIPSREELYKRWHREIESTASLQGPRRECGE